MKLPYSLSGLTTTVGLGIFGLGLLALGCKNESNNTGTNTVNSTTTLTGAGSTFVEPMMGKWAELYQREKGTKINYQGGGSGAGIKQMIDQAVDFGCTDAFMKDEDLAKAAKANGDVVHIPLVMGGVVPAYNLEAIAQPLKFTGPVLADIYLGKIKKWNEQPLKDLNPGVDLPDKPITTVHRADASGTTSIFTDYLCKVSPEFNEKVGKGTTVGWPGAGGGEKGTPGVANFVKSNPGSIGYVELIYALQQKIGFGSVRNKAGKDILASLESVSKAAAGLNPVPEDLRYSITNADGEDAYPISGTTWAVLYVKQPPDKAKQVVDFLRWITHEEGQKYTKDLQYAPLPAEIVQNLDKKLDRVAAGK